MPDPHREPALGVIGGMGPLASAEFVKTIYQLSSDRPEQEAPVVILYSDPTFPDRTEALLTQSYGPLLNKLLEALTALHAQGVRKIVICCFTIHYLLPQLPPQFRERIISLINVVFNALAQHPRRSLLLCTTGTRQLMLFQHDPRWPDIEQQIVLPDAQDQAEIHRQIYAIKRGADLGGVAADIQALLARYGCGSFIAGCTEFHLLARHLATHAPHMADYVDPLSIIAQHIAKDTPNGSKKHP